ncbi:hypothetical protein C4J81_03305 [Deltaproteobacteria bacterium Smac51]|nr:hypothetical protein C4J81_03305 [Deltaproteobacteria bacterium Smac51]
MQITQHNSYNSLGRIGPHYERPEYRPPEQNAPETQPETTRGDRSTLSTRNTDVPVKKAVAMPTGKVNLAAAKDLTEATASLIQGLTPESTSQEPHMWLRSSLMTPVYA